MGGKRHKGIGMNRPKKKRSLPSEPVEEGLEVSEDDEDDEPNEFEEPEPSSPTQPESAPAEAASAGMYTRLGRAKAWAQLQEAEKKLKIVERRWKKKLQTFHKSGKYSPWEVASLRKRWETRMYYADKELGEARALRAHRRGRWRRWVSYERLSKQFHKDATPETMEAFRIAMRRLTTPTPVPDWKAMWPGLGTNIWETNARQFGLGITWGLTHVDCLREPDVPGETEVQHQRRVQAQADESTKVMLRKWIEAHVEKCKTDRHLRFSSRPCLTGWCSRPELVAEVLRDMGECLCREAGRGDCEMCLGKL